MSEQEKTFKYEFNVTMNCGGCSGAIDRVLKKLKEKDDPDVQDYQVSLKEQTVLVDSTLSYKEVLEKITKTGKTVNSGKEDGDRRPYKIAEDGELVPLSSEEQEQAEEDKPVDGDKKEDSKPAESEEQAVDSKKDGKEQ